MLPAERAKASFAVGQLVEMMRGDRLSLAQKYKDELFTGEVFDARMDDYRSYADLFEQKMLRAAKAFDIVRSNVRFMADHMKQKVPMNAMFSGGGSAAGLHFSMFLTYLETQGSPEQLKVWRAKARQGRFLGCYAQTELGH
eukprot:gene7873-15347_t